jgi:Ca-activated chloride channel family protein
MERDDVEGSTMLTALTLLAILAAAAPALAQDLTVDEGQVRISRHEVAVEIHERVAATTVTQVFQNVDSRVREGTYFFALPPGAGLVDFTMWIGDRVMKGEVLERERADAAYLAITRKMVDPGILDHVRDNIWRIRVFPIPASGGEMKFRTKYVEVLPFHARAITYTLPLTIPRARAALMDRFEVDLRARSATPVREITAPGMTIQRKSSTEFLATIDRTAVEFEKDLVLRYEVGEGDLDMALLAHRPGPDPGHFLITLTPGTATAPAERAPREVAFLLDASGSIDEAVFRSSVQAVVACLLDLTPEDRFNIVAFNSRPRPFRRQAVAATAEQVKAAADFLAKIERDGRTDLEEALSTVLSDPTEIFRVIFLVTDGALTAGLLDPATIAGSILKKIDARTHLFAVRTGPSPDRTLETIVERAGGECVESDARALARTLQGALKRFQRPALTDVKLDFGKAGVTALHADGRGLLLADGQMVVAGRYARPGSHEVTLTGRVGPREFRMTRTLEFPERQENGSAAAYVWASREITARLGQMLLDGETKARREAVIGLSKAHRILTPYTAFLVLENDEMYAQYGLERTASKEQPLFHMRRKPRKYVGNPEKTGTGITGLPNAPTNPVDLYKAVPQASLRTALSWLAEHRDAMKPLRDGNLRINETGAHALALSAFIVSCEYEFPEADQKKFEAAVDQTIDALLKAQGKDGALAPEMFDHALAANALARLSHAGKFDARVRLAFQKAVAYLSDSPGALKRTGVANVAVPLLLAARDAGLEVDRETIREAEENLISDLEGTYILARLALDPRADRDDRVFAAAGRIVRRGPADPSEAWWGTEALLAWRGVNSMEWKQWQKKVAEYRKAKAENGSYLPKRWREDSRGGATALLALILEAYDRK